MRRRTQAAGRVEAQSTKNTILNTAPLAYAVRLIHQVCCFAGSFDLLGEFCDQALCVAVDRRDSAALFDRLMHDFSFQGISDEVAANYMRRHGQATWRSVRKNLARGPACPKLKSYWHFHACRYEKTNGTCAEPDHIAACPLPTHRLRNGHLNQIAYSLYLFIRDVADGDLVGWIDDCLDQVNDQAPSDPLARVRMALIEPLRNVYGVADKVLAMALSGTFVDGRPIGATPASEEQRKAQAARDAADAYAHRLQAYLLGGAHANAGALPFRADGTIHWDRLR